MDRYQVFISYKRDIDEEHIEGSAMARRLYEELEKKGFHTFFDKEEMGLNSYKENIEAAILSSDVFILVVSHNVFSENVEWEIDKALTDERRIIIPIGKDRAVLAVLDEKIKLKDNERFSLEEYCDSSGEISYSSVADTITHRLSRRGVIPTIGEKDKQRIEAKKFFESFRELVQTVLSECKTCKRYQEKACPFIHDATLALHSPDSWAEGQDCWDGYRLDYYTYEFQSECEKLEIKYGKGHLFEGDAKFPSDFQEGSIVDPCKAQRENIKKFKDIDLEPMNYLSYAELKELSAFCGDMIAQFSSEAEEKRIADSVNSLLQSHKMLLSHRLAELVANRVFIEKSFSTISIIDNLKKADDHLSSFLLEKRTKITLSEHQLLYELWWRTRPEALDLTILEIMEQKEESGDLHALIDSFLDHFQELSKQALNVLLEFPYYASPQTLDLDEREWFVCYRNPQIENREREMTNLQEKGVVNSSIDFENLETREKWMPFLDFRWDLSDLVWLDEGGNNIQLFDEANNPRFKDNKAQDPPYLVRVAFDDERSIESGYGFRLSEDSYDSRLSDTLRDYARGYSLGALVDQMKELKARIAASMNTTPIDKRLYVFRNNALNWFYLYSELATAEGNNDREQSEDTIYEEPLDRHSACLFNNKKRTLGQVPNADYERGYVLYSQEGISSIRARICFKKAAEDGVLEACVILGNILSRSEDENELIEAIRWYEKAFAGGCRFVAKGLIEAYQKVGEYEKALQLSRYCHNTYLYPVVTTFNWLPPYRVASNNLWSHDVNQGDLYFNTGDIKSAENEYLRLGTTYDYFRLLNCVSWQEWEGGNQRDFEYVFHVSLGMPKDQAKAMSDAIRQEIFEEILPGDLSPSQRLTSKEMADLPSLAQTGDREAQFYFAMLLLEEIMHGQQFPAVFYWLDLAAKNGHRKALFLLLSFYVRTEIYGYSPEALFKINPLFLQDSMANIYDLMMSEIAEDVLPEDFSLGQDLSPQQQSELRAVAQQGNADAQFEFAMLSLEKMINDPKFQTVIGWLSKAAMNGHRKALTFLVSFYEKTGKEKEHKSEIRKCFVACIRHRFSELFPDNTLNDFTIPDRVSLSDVWGG